MTRSRLAHVALLVLPFSILLGLLAPVPGSAQAGRRVHRVGFLAGSSAAAAAIARAAVVDGLGDFGYRLDGGLVLIERYADGKFERLDTLAAELVKLEPDVILTSTTPAALAARRATSTIPIVVVTGGDLVGAGVVASLARPGANVTGLSFLGTELTVKQMELLKEIVPTIRVLGLLGNGAIQPEVLFFAEMKSAAPGLGVSVRFVDAKGPSDYETAFASIKQERVEGIVVAPNLIYLDNRKTIVALAARARLPAVYQSREFPAAGGLVSYGIDRARFFRRAAVYVDKVLKGARPGDLPVEQPTKFELIVNMKTARELGLTVPQSVLVRADEIIR